MAARRGHTVRTKLGRVGYTYDDEPLINGKKTVHVTAYCKADPTKIMVDPEKLTLTRPMVWYK